VLKSDDWKKEKCTVIKKENDDDLYNFSQLKSKKKNKVYIKLNLSNHNNKKRLKKIKKMKNQASYNMICKLSNSSIQLKWQLHST